MIYDNSAVHDAHLEEVRALMKGLGYQHFGIFKSGSAYYGKENPADYDIVVLLYNTQLRTVMELLKQDGWTDCAEDLNIIPSGGDERTPGYGQVWGSVRKHDINIIFTTEVVWYYREQAATELTRRFAQDEGEVLPKEEVIELFAMIRDGREP